MNIQHIFSNFLISKELDLDTNEILQFCNTIRNSNDANQYDLTFKEPQLQALYAEVKNMLPDITNMLQLKQSIHQKIYNGWLTFEYHNNILKPHNHPRQFIAFVYYPLADENCGNLVLMNPNQVQSYVIPTSRDENIVDKWNEFNSNAFRIKPKANHIFAFPSWLTHYVEKSPIQIGKRISIAMNTRIFADNYSFFGGVTTDGNPTVSDWLK